VQAEAASNANKSVVRRLVFPARFLTFIHLRQQFCLTRSEVGLAAAGLRILIDRNLGKEVKPYGPILPRRLFPIDIYLC
jgi:hypothetical protein